MARKTSKSASKDVESAMRRRKKGTLKSGSGKTVKSKKQAIAIGLSEARKKGTLKSGGSGKTVKSKKQAIAIGLSEARRKGAKAPKKKRL